MIYLSQQTRRIDYKNQLQSNKKVRMSETGGKLACNVGWGGAQPGQASAGRWIAWFSGSGS